jgi:rhodanese-related sulfurtransferase
MGNGVDMKKTVMFLLFVLCFSFSFVPAVQAEGTVPFKKDKQTVLGKYATAQEAYDMWRADPTSIHVVDVRTPEEYVFVGHATMAVNIPIEFHEWDAAGGEMKTVENTAFEDQIKARFSKDAVIYLMCRSGARGARAVNRLAEYGYTNVYNITDGFEGDKVKDKRSVYKGKRFRNGWKNALSDWTYDLDPELVYRTRSLKE